MFEVTSIEFTQKTEIFIATAAADGSAAIGRMNTASPELSKSLCMIARYVSHSDVVIDFYEISDGALLYFYVGV